MSEKVPARPAWYKNTYFWIAAALLLLSISAFLRGPDVIRDPGQKREGGLALWYLVASVVMYVNGWLSHQQTVRLYREMVGDAETAESKPTEAKAPDAIAPPNPATAVPEPSTESQTTEETR
ncbi:MAG TPA: hypothetical protein VKT78_20735 [Fimbriimonadaceae bacterium]|nr:hypothetical protein [Fimbriimonadaceae bacterium]